MIERSGWVMDHPLRTGAQVHVVTREWFDEVSRDLAQAQSALATAVKVAAQEHKDAETFKATLRQYLHCRHGCIDCFCTRDAEAVLPVECDEHSHYLLPPDRNDCACGEVGRRIRQHVAEGNQRFVGRACRGGPGHDDPDNSGFCIKCGGATDV